MESTTPAPNPTSSTKTTPPKEVHSKTSQYITLLAIVVGLELIVGLLFHAGSRLDPPQFITNEILFNFVLLVIGFTGYFASKLHAYDHTKRGGRRMLGLIISATLVMFSGFYVVLSGWSHFEHGWLNVSGLTTNAQVDGVRLLKVGYRHTNTVDSFAEADRMVIIVHYNGGQYAAMGVSLKGSNLGAYATLYSEAKYTRTIQVRYLPGLRLVVRPEVEFSNHPVDDTTFTSDSGN